MNICFQVGKSQRDEGGSDGACDEASGQWQVPRNRGSSVSSKSLSRRRRKQSERKSRTWSAKSAWRLRGERFSVVLSYYPPTTTRHRYAKKSAGELERLGEELERIVVELTEVVHQPSAPSL